MAGSRGSRGSSSSHRGASSRPAPAKAPAPAKVPAKAPAHTPAAHPPAPAKAPTHAKPPAQAPAHAPAQSRPPAHANPPAPARTNLPARTNQPSRPPAHAPSAHPPAQPQRSTAGTFMRSAMIGLGAGMLTSLGLNALFGNRHHDKDGNVAGAQEGVAAEEGQGLDRTDFIAAVGGAGAAMGVATLMKNRNLLSSRSTAVTPYSAAIRPPFQLPRRYMVISILGAIGGLVGNSMRKVSNKLSEQPPTYEPTAYGYDQPTTNKWGDEIEGSTTTA